MLATAELKKERQLDIEDQLRLLGKHFYYFGTEVVKHRGCVRASQLAALGLTLGRDLTP